MLAQPRPPGPIVVICSRASEACLMSVRVAEHTHETSQVKYRLDSSQDEKTSSPSTRANAPHKQIERVHFLSLEVHATLKMPFNGGRSAFRFEMSGSSAPNLLPSIDVRTPSQFSLLIPLPLPFTATRSAQCVDASPCGPSLAEHRTPKQPWAAPLLPPSSSQTQRSRRSSSPLPLRRPQCSRRRRRSPT